ncbi:acyclic terpene utilization AtuA family protein [Rhodoligotrophos defluvii]|uniref:acyclic terpene utilization AtuA family protein n=1 Tax=Rhodoligotrophos defluvii TaxID=2561934 RepID=UPI0010C95085|nr:acyclic terpene utilization AtuA family protein [Rhodoligotrophos defluvii]
MNARRDKILRIGCGGGFWGDTGEGPAQLVRSGQIDVLVVDYLAEITMSLLARARAKDPAGGFVPDFVQAIGALGPELAERGIRVVVNAGGVNPLGCRDALAAKFEAAGVSLNIGVVLGDDVTPVMDRLRDEGVTEMFTGAPLPAKPWSANAYLGAFPIAAVLAAGADVVITGRCTDSALVLGPMIHAFGWGPTDYDRLSMGSLAGHIVECGAQATGGLATDWQEVEGWDDMGLPIVECSADGTFVVTKPSGTGGKVTPETVAEQIVYEIGDPAAYILPDVVADWRDVHLTQVGSNRVQVTGARGRAPTRHYKASITAPDGFKAVGTLMIGGRDAVAKARRTAEAVLTRSRRLMAARGLSDFRRVSVEVLGAEDTYGPHGRGARSREVILKAAVHHDDKAACEIFSREFLPSATAMAQGITGFAAGRPKVSPVVRLYSCLVDKTWLTPRVVVNGEEQTVETVIPNGDAVADGPQSDLAAPAPAPVPEGPRVKLPLIALAYGRSGDKGDFANIGILARRPAFLAVIAEAVTPRAVAGYFAHLVKGPVERFPLPGLVGFNFLMHNALDGGGIASLRHDPQGKAFAQMLLDMPVPVPAAWLEPGGPLHGSPYAGEAAA